MDLWRKDFAPTRIKSEFGKLNRALLAGHALYRLDSYKGDRTYRLRGAPTPGAVFVDDETWPSADRRAYYVIAVDGAGQLGVPSSPGWARNMP